MKVRGSGWFENDGALTFTGDQLLVARDEDVEFPESEEALIAAPPAAELVRPGRTMPERRKKRAARQTSAMTDDLYHKAIEVVEWLSVDPSETVEGWENIDPSDGTAAPRRRRDRTSSKRGAVTTRVPLARVLSAPEAFEGWLYLPSSRPWTGSTEGFFVELLPGEQPPVPEGTRACDYVQTLDVAMIEDVVANARDQLRDPSADQLVSAFVFFVDNDAFIDLQTGVRQTSACSADREPN